jgi:hypothetical protein
MHGKQIIVTITESPAMPGGFYYTISVNGRRLSTGNSAGRDPAAAAAKAVELAINHPGAYCILAPQKVIDCIPESVRSGMMR